MKQQEVIDHLMRTEGQAFNGAEVKNAIIKSVSLTRNDGDRGILGCWLHLDYGSCCQSFGGRALYLPKSYTHHKMESVAGHYIYRILECADVENFDELVGRSVRVITTQVCVYAVGHIINDDFFCPAIDFKKPEDGA
jgi:hypothetical protein